MFLCVLSGCSLVEYFRPEQPPYDSELAATYRATKLKESTSAAVLTMINRPASEVLSQSKKVVASSGQKKNGSEIWLNLVAFDENKLTARRKYFFVVDEEPKVLSWSPKHSFLFKSEMVLAQALLDEPYASENARRIAVLQKVRENVQRDVEEVAADNKLVATCGMLINQALETVLRDLEETPSLASNLDKADGVAVHHITLGSGNISMNILGDTAIVEMKIGSRLSRFEAQQQ